MSILDIQRENDYMITLPMYEGEKALCVVNRAYAAHLMRREVEVDWALVKEIKHLVLTSPWPTDSFWQEERKDIERHYEDAFNEKLPEERRRTHAEIVFARMWMYVQNMKMPMQFPLDQFVAMNLQAGLT